MIEEKISYLNYINTLKISEEQLANDKVYTLKEVYHHLANINRNAIFCSGLTEIFNSNWGTDSLYPFIRDIFSGMGASYLQEKYYCAPLNDWRLLKREMSDDIKEIYKNFQVIEGCVKYEKERYD